MKHRIGFSVIILMVCLPVLVLAGSWTQTTKEDFEAGVLENLDTSSSPGDVMLKSVANTNVALYTYGTTITCSNAIIYGTLQSLIDGNYSSVGCQCRGVPATYTLDFGQVRRISSAFFRSHQVWGWGFYRITRYRYDALIDGTWTTVFEESNNTTDFRSDNFSPPVLTNSMRFVILACVWPDPNLQEIEFYEQTYANSGTLTSVPHHTEVNYPDYSTISWDATVLSGTTLKFQIRSAHTEEELQYASWYGPTGTTDYYIISGTLINQVHNFEPWIQYRAYFETADLTVSPTLHEITISWADVPVVIEFYNTPYYSFTGNRETWDYMLGNNTDADQTFDWWLEFSGPITKDLVLEQNKILPAYSKEEGRILLRVPKKTPVGLYTVTGCVGYYDSIPKIYWSTTSFDCEVVAKDRMSIVYGDYSDDWQVEILPRVYQTNTHSIECFNSSEQKNNIYSEDVSVVVNSSVNNGGISVRYYDLTGRLINHTEWNNNNLPAGVYFIRDEDNRCSVVRRFVLIR